MLRLHRRFGPAVVLWLGLAAAAADIAGRLPGLDRVGQLNFLLVWLFAHQLGFLYADGTLAGWSRRAHAAMAGGGLAALVALTASGAWPPSMVGLPGDRVSNMSPPSLCMVALTVWLVGLAMVVRAQVTRWVERPRPWALVVTAGSALMALFLWHLTALVLAVLVLHPLGLTEPAPGTPTWWLCAPCGCWSPRPCCGRWWPCSPASNAPARPAPARVRRSSQRSSERRGRSSGSSGLPWAGSGRCPAWPPTGRTPDQPGGRAARPRGRGGAAGAR